MTPPKRVDLDTLTADLETTHKAEIETLIKNRTGNKKIKKILEEKYGSKISLRALEKARKHWDVKSPRLKDFQNQILQWDSDGEETGEIIENIFKLCGYRFGWPAVYSQINKWKGSKKVVGTRAPLKEGRKWNLDFFQDDFLGWKKDGLDIKGMLEKFEKKHNLYTSANNLEKSFKLWGSTWREIGAGQNHLPMDQRTKTDIESMEISLKAAYQADLQAAPSTLLDLTAWQKCLVEAACYDRGIQALVVKEFYQPGYHCSTTRSFNPLWVMGIQLPGSYCFEEVNSHSKIMAIVDSLAPDILKEVWTKLRAWLDSALIAERASGAEDTLESALSVYPATTPPACIAKLLRLTRSDMDQARSEARLKKLIADESGSLGPASHALAECLSKTRIEDSMVQSYSAIVIERLSSWLGPGIQMSTLSPLAESDLAIIEDNLSIGGTCEDDNTSDTDNNSDEEEEEADLIEQEDDYDSNLDSLDGEEGSTDAREDGQERDQTDESDDDETGDGSEAQDENDDKPRKNTRRKIGAHAKRNEDMFHGARFLRLHRILGEQVGKLVTPMPLGFKDWFAPTTGALLEYSPARFGFATWEPERKSLMQTIISADLVGNTKEEIRVQSIRDGQMFLAGDYCVNSDADRDEIFGESVQYLEMIIESQTSKENESYRVVCERMSACTTRPAGAEDLEEQLGNFSSIQRDDNWLHVRRLLQMLSYRYSLEESRHAAFEFQLMTLLAAIECGSTEAILWFIPLEGCLEEISKQIKASALVSGQLSNQEQRLHDNLLRALATFAHGVAMNNLTFRSVMTTSSIRVKNKYVLEPSTVQKWYSVMYNTDPRCSLSGCSRLLPHPSLVKARSIQKAFSIGNNDARSGSMKTRSFISNRGSIYPCLIQWLQNYEPESVLVIAFFFYAGLYHVDSSCKAKRGKRLQNF